MSEATAVVGIVATALHASKLVYNDIKAIANAPETVTKLYREVEELNQKLELVSKIENDEWQTLGPSATDCTKSVLTKYETTCKTFHKDLKRWTKHSEGKGEDLSKLDQFTLGFYRHKEIASFCQQLQSCKLSFVGTIGLASLHSSIRNGTTMSTALALHRQSTEEHNDKVQSQLEAMNKTIEELSLEGRSERFEDGSETREDLNAAVAQLAEACAAMRASKALLQELMAKPERETKAQKPSVTQSNTFGSIGKSTQVASITGDPIFNLQ